MAETVLILGDSISYGSGASAAPPFATVVCNAAGVTPDNNAVSGVQIGGVRPQYLDDYSSVAATQRTIFLTGTNDMRAFGTGAARLNDYAATLLYIAAHMATPESSKIRVASGSITYAGSWTDNGSLGGVKFSSANGATATITTTARWVVIFYLLIDGGGGFAVDVGGVQHSTGSCLWAGNTTGSTMDFWPAAVLIDTGSTASKAVAFRTAGVNNTFLYGFVPLDGSALGPRVVIGGCPNLPAAGYAQDAPYNQGSEEAVALYNVRQYGVCRRLAQAGLDVRFVSGRLNPQTDFADLVHPNDAGHLRLARRIAPALLGDTIQLDPHDVLSGVTGYVGAVGDAGISTDSFAGGATVPQVDDVGSAGRAGVAAAVRTSVEEAGSVLRLAYSAAIEGAVQASSAGAIAAQARDNAAEATAAVEALPDLRGPGAFPVTLTFYSDPPTNSVPIADADVWVTSDAEGADVVAGTLQTDSDGAVAFLLDDGASYYVWLQKDGVQSIQGEAFTAEAD